MPSDEAPRPQSILIDWANKQDGWVRELTAEVIASRKEVSAERAEFFYDQMLVEKHLRSGTPVAVPSLSDRALRQKDDGSLVLLSLRDVENVNALAQKQSITFNRRMTILYGENASGKTGYVRVLKRIADVRTAEVILGNISAGLVPNTSPSGLIEYELNGKPQKLGWQNEAGVHPLTRIDVFDSGSTRVHVDEDLSYVFTPGELALFPMVQQSLEKVKARLHSSIQALTSKTNRFLPLFERGTEVYAKMETLGAASDLAELNSLATLSAGESEEVASLEREITALRSGNVPVLLQVSKAQLSVFNRVKEATEVLARSSPGEIGETLKELLILQEETSAALRGAAERQKLPKKALAQFEAFISSAEDVFEAAMVPNYPEESSICVYCSQDLKGDSKLRIRSLRDSQGTRKQRIQELSRKLTAAQDSFNKFSFGELAGQVSALQGENGDAEITNQVITSLKKAEEFRTNVSARRETHWPSFGADVDSLRSICQARIKASTEFAKALGGREEDRKRELTGREARFKTLQARQQLAKHIQDVKEYVENAKWVYQAGLLQAKFMSLFRSLTDSSKEASEKLLNQDFEQRFGAECKRLRCPPVRVFFPGKQGSVSRRKLVAQDHLLSEILSEGEQKVIALADFLAELSLKPACSPVVFDDPINSLDYRRMEEVVNRIVELSAQRQVIIFTHNIWFVAQLLSRFEDLKTECSYFDVTRDGANLGLVQGGSNPRTDTFNYYRGRINEHIQAAEKVSGEVQASLIEKAYEYVRGACEVFTEQDLLKGVVSRFSPMVRVTMLPQLPIGKLENAIQGVLPLYDKSCRVIASHSQPIETLNVRPTLDELKADWTTLKALREQVVKQP